MGIPLLLTWLRNCCTGCFRSAEPPAPGNDQERYSCDNLYVDLNSVLYHAVKHVLGANDHFVRSFKSGQSVVHAPAGENFETLVLQQYVTFLDELLFNLSNPTAMCFLAADGVSPKAKMPQQRQRRHGNGMKHTNRMAREVFGFDVNCITSGSAFMARVSQVTEWYAASRVQQCTSGSRGEAQRNLVILVDDSMAPGEGEFKMLRYLRLCRSNEGYDPNVKHCICSTDTDVIVCALPLHEPQIDVLRVSDVGEPSMFFSMKDFREVLFDRVRRPSDHSIFERGLHDMVFILLLFGSDFLPKLFSADVASGQLDRLISFLATDFITCGKHLVVPETLKINTENVVYFLQNVDSCLDVGEEVGGKRSRGNLSILGGGGAAEWGFEESENDKKMAAAREAQQVRVARSYWEGLVWSLRYYCGECPSWQWFYPHGESPSLPHLYKESMHADTVIFDTPEDQTTITPFEQLFLLTPRTSADILPMPLRDMYTTLEEAMAPSSTVTETIQFTRLPFTRIHELCVERSKRLSAKEMNRLGRRGASPFSAIADTVVQKEVRKAANGGRGSIGPLSPLQIAGAPEANVEVIVAVDSDDDWGDFKIGAPSNATAAAEASSPKIVSKAPEALSPRLLRAQSSQHGPAISSVVLSRPTFTVGLEKIDETALYRSCFDETSRAAFASDLVPGNSIIVLDADMTMIGDLRRHTIGLLPGCKTTLPSSVPTPPPQGAAPSSGDLAKEALAAKKAALRQKLQAKEKSALQDQIGSIMKAP